MFSKLGLANLVSWYFMLLHKQYVYRTTRGRLLGVYVPDRRVFHSQKAFFSNTLFPYGFSTILRRGSHMASSFSFVSSLKDSHFSGLSTFLTNYIQYTQHFSLARKHFIFKDSPRFRSKYRTHVSRAESSFNKVA